MSDYLHEEVVAEILKRLPVKSLLKFTSVCKSWYDLITNPNFISLHLAHTTESNKIYHLFKRDDRVTEPQLVLHNDNDSFSEYKDLDSASLYMSNSHFYIVGSYNGLVCLFDVRNRKLIVWNPAIVEFITTSLTELREGLFNFLGFGFDRKNNDYKVVRIVYDLADITLPPIIEIFELSSNSWKTVTVKNLDAVVFYFGSHVQFNGVPHWFAKIHNGRKQTVASFDLSNEAFQELMLPHALAEIDNSRNYLSLTVYSQSLAVIHYKDWISGSCNIKCSIWVMKEYGAAESWTKQISMDLESHGGFRFVFSFLGNGGILVEDCYGMVASYDRQTQRVTPLGVYLPECNHFSYIESLLLLKEKRNNKVQSSIEE